MGAPFPAIQPHWRDVASDRVNRIGWVPSGMIVEFKKGGPYLYEGVSRQRFVACAGSDSIGTYIDRKIKPKYTAVKLS